MKPFSIPKKIRQKSLFFRQEKLKLSEIPVLPIEHSCAVALNQTLCPALQLQPVPLSWHRHTPVTIACFSQLLDIFFIFL